MNYNINNIFTPEFISQRNTLQASQANIASQPEEISKMIHALDDFFKAYKNVTFNYKAQASFITATMFLDEFNNGTFNY